MTLRARMGLAAAVAGALAVLAVAVSAYAGTRSTLRGQVDTQLSGIAGQLLHPPGPQGDEGLFGTVRQRQSTPDNGRRSSGSILTPGTGDCDRGLGVNNPTRQPFGGARGFVQLVTPRGHVCRGSGETAMIPVDPQVQGVARSSHGRFFTDRHVGSIHIRVLVTGVSGFGALMVALPLTEVDHTLGNELVLLLIIAACGIVLATLLGILVARTALAPIARFTRQTEAIAAAPERIERDRLDVTGGDELARLAETFNRTLDALEQSIAAQRNLVADASHELRTPIASVRANLQLLRDESLLPPAERDALRRDMIDELDELTALVGDVVELARGSKPSDERGEVRLDDIVSAAVEKARRRAPNLTLITDTEPTLVRGEGERLARAVANLLDNAAKWSPDGGTIEVNLDGGVVTVRDHGPGFREEDLPFVFDRFHRAADARSKPGSGLGLAIVRQAAEAHGGFARAENAPDGGAVLRVGFGAPLPLGEEVAAEAAATGHRPVG